jgi:hypothetical protein
VVTLSTPETEWDEVEQGWMLALYAHRANRCRGCGGDLRVTTAPENEEAFKRELPAQCHRCVALDLSHEAYRDQPHPHSYLHRISMKR